MDNKELSGYIDQGRWLINNGLVPDSVKNQLFFYGSVVHQDVQAVEVKIVPETKLVEYLIYVNGSVIKKMETYKRLSTATSLFGIWRFKRFLKKEGCLDFQSMLNTFVADYCGPKWVAKVQISNFDTYVDSIGVEGEPDRSNQQTDQSLN